MFDQYWDLSIEEAERVPRRLLDSCLEVKIHGPPTSMPKRWEKFIYNPQKKVNFSHFLCVTFCDLGRQHLSPGKTLLLVKDLRMENGQ